MTGILSAIVNFDQDFVHAPTLKAISITSQFLILLRFCCISSYKKAKNNCIIILLRNCAYIFKPHVSVLDIMSLPQLAVQKITTCFKFGKLSAQDLQVRLW